MTDGNGQHEDQKDEEAKKPDEKAVLGQNLSIGGSKAKENTQKGARHQHGKETTNVMTPTRTKNLQEDMARFIHDQEKEEAHHRDKESKGWDLKFQNYWGYIIAADSNYE